jgi:type IX secretion system substrate protein
MKKLYTVFFALAILLIANFPLSGFAQCLCSGGLPATAVTYYNVLDTTNASSSTISFPKFDPSIGTLSCVTFIDTISGITTTNVQNTGSTKTLYKFLLTVANNISGPGVNVDDDYTRNYGPDSLNAAGDHPGDSIVYGPDNIFNNVQNTTTASATAPYLGSSGNVNFVYTLNGGLIALAGGLNYNSQIVTNYWGTFSLTYYWCPTLPLAANISNFTAFKNGKYIDLQWQASNEPANISYQIESSKDGSNFQPAGSIPASASDAESTLAYQFKYPLSNADAGKLYFRVKRIDAAGKFSYTTVKIINLDGAGMSGYQVYPNPVSNTVMLEFNDAQTGNFVVSLVNTAGQAIQQKTVTLAGGNQIRMDLNNQPPAGLYYLHAKDQTHNLQYVTKVLIK